MRCEALSRGPLRCRLTVMVLTPYLALLPERTRGHFHAGESPCRRAGGFGYLKPNPDPSKSRESAIGTEITTIIAETIAPIQYTTGSFLRV
jgi:hypothetical protein